MKYLFFDTETTGVPRNYNAPASDVDNWCRMVQIGWLMYDGHDIETSREYIVRPEGYEIPVSASSVHGITTERALHEGRDLREVMEFFGDAVGVSDLIVGHNVSFDLGTAGAEFHRVFGYNPLEGKKTFCTMKSTCEFVGITNYYGFKYPKLTELWYKLFGTQLPQTHTALDDIQNTSKCFFELERLGIIKLEKSEKAEGEKS